LGKPETTGFGLFLFAFRIGFGFSVWDLGFSMAGKNKKKKNAGEGVLATNRKAQRDFHILEKIEAGIVLTGTEVKSVKQGHSSIQEGYVHIDDHMEAWLIGCTIQPYDHGNVFNHNQTRERKLLLHRKEIARLYGKIREKGLTIVPLKIYLVRGKIKIKIGLAKGKNVVDKRDTIRKREADRDSQRAMRNHNHR
jgi:SsrA-binding protein